MSEKVTRLNIPGQRDFPGWIEHSEQSAAYMIDRARKHADVLRAMAAAIDAASDADFQIDIVKGPYVQHHVRELQRSALLPAAAATSQKDEAHAQP